MTIFEGRLNVHAILYPSVVEGHLTLKDDSGHDPRFVLFIEKRPWDEWKSWLSPTVPETIIDLADATLRQGEDWTSEKIALTIPHTLTRSDIKDAF